MPERGATTWTCSCNGCWACSGHEAECTCDVDWDRLYEEQRDRAADYGSSPEPKGGA